MSVPTIKTALPGLKLIEPKVFKDPRGLFLETFHQKKYAAEGIDRTFVQSNHSRSSRGTLRGLHYQLQFSQGKLLYVVTGEIFDVAVDIRRGSPTFGQWEGYNLSDENRRQLYIPEGFAHGFYVLSEYADVLYFCTELYHPEDDFGILWSDPRIGIEWPVSEGAPPLLSEKDNKLKPLDETPETDLPVYSVE